MNKTRRNGMLSLYMKYQNIKNRLLNDEEGQGLVEYVLIIVLIALIVMSAINPVTVALQNAFSKIATCLGT
jgi:Flp pilus assembly pilin Flp